MTQNGTFSLLRAGQTADAIQMLQSAFAGNPSASNAMGLGVAYLWCGEYGAAAEHFQNTQLQPPGTKDIYYKMAGVARWCVGAAEGAIGMWQSGLKAQYTDAAGGVGIPLLLYFASIREPTLFPRAKAEQLLAKKSQGALANNWPAPVAKFVLGMISREKLEIDWSGKNETDRLCIQMKLRFYEGTLALASGNEPNFAESMRSIADTTRPEWSGGAFYPSCLWHAEFFLARHESSSRAVSGS